MDCRTPIIERGGGTTNPGGLHSASEAMAGGESGAEGTTENNYCSELLKISPLI